MKQQVNLYQHRLRPIRQPLALRRLLLSWTVLAGVLLLAAWLLQQHNQQRSTLLNQQQQQLDQQLQQVALFQQALTQRQASAALQKQLQLLEQSVQQKQQLLSYLSQQQQQASQLYSPVLQHLQQIDRPELWLTHFSLAQQHSSFTGITLQPRSVPQWLEQLRELSYFRGQRFRQVQMQQLDDNSAVSFELVAEQGATP
ncbi:PilN domain-containing protein [Rheinheimera nanhaiensis]|uniref:MSHA biogenesis protein MshI n=1 Tax=Rheinheimera nanhaiensis E407-8 TaxID=562729 RepID=I1DWA0_9GAMM|nr:PilN domain-containing protein [Rheinheimera nanhaiensis]GAB58328.1 hypothetical protein RNAN_1300 [Rheinheimera nanhaiensis E407-8]